MSGNFHFKIYDDDHQPSGTGSFGSRLSWIYLRLNLDIKTIFVTEERMAWIGAVVRSVHRVHPPSLLFIKQTTCADDDDDDNFSRVIAVPSLFFDIHVAFATHQISNGKESPYWTF